MASASRYNIPVTDCPRKSLQSGIGLPMRFLGFWTAVVVPFVLLGLVAAGIAQQSPLLLSGLLAANILGLVLGRDYKR